jgi:hypothetical protein
MSDEPKIVCAIELPAPARERLLRIGTEELARPWRAHDGRPTADMRTVYYALCPLWLGPTWRSSDPVGDEKTIRAELSPYDLCSPCSDARFKFPDVFQWVSYVLGMRGLIGGEAQL